MLLLGPPSLYPTHLGHHRAPLLSWLIYHMLDLEKICIFWIWDFVICRCCKYLQICGRPFKLLTGIFYQYIFLNLEFSRWLSCKESTCQCKGRRFHPWVRMIPWSRKWQPTPVFLPGKYRGQRSLAGYSPWDHKRGRFNIVTKLQILKFNVGKQKGKKWKL